MQVRYSFDGQLIECKAAQHFCSPTSIDPLLNLVNHLKDTLASHLARFSAKEPHKVKQAENKSVVDENAEENLPKVQKVTGAQKTLSTPQKIINPREALLNLLFLTDADQKYRDLSHYDDLQIQLMVDYLMKR
jgi:hypothetical protein